MFQLPNEGQSRRDRTRRDPNTNNGSAMELRTYWRMLSKNWWIVVASTVLGLLLALGASALMTPKYESTGTLYVSVRGANLDTSGDLFQGASFAQAETGRAPCRERYWVTGGAVSLSCTDNG